MDRGVQSTTMKLLDDCRANDWAGYEPYDVLNSPIVNALPFLDFRLFVELASPSSGLQLPMRGEVVS
jgi:hypothetical protein